MIFTAIILSVLVLLLWGLGDYLLGKSGAEIDVYLTNLIQSLVGVVAMLPLVLYFGLSFQPVAILITALIAFLSAGAYLFYIRAFSIGPFGVVGPLANSYPLVTVFLGVVFLGAQVTLLQLFALLAIVTGVILLSVNRDTLPGRDFLNSTALLSVGAALGWGVGYALFDLVLTEMLWFELFFFLALFQSIFALLFYVRKHMALPTWESIQYRSTRLAWNAGVLLATGFAVFFIAASLLGSVIIPAVIASASPLVICILAFYRDGERLSLNKRAGAVIIVLGIMALNAVS